MPLPFVEIRARGDDGLVPWDGETLGELEVRGPWVAERYYHADENDDRFCEDGWFKTGDIVRIDPSGCIELADRTKDLVKSGGEWISSVALEGALMGHPAVAEAAVIAVPHAELGRAPARRRRAQAGSARDARRSAGVPRAAVREMVAAGRLRVRRRDSADLGREISEVGAAGALPRRV